MESIDRSMGSRIHPSGFHEFRYGIIGIGWFETDWTGLEWPCSAHVPRWVMVTMGHNIRIKKPKTLKGKFTQAKKANIVELVIEKSKINN